MHVNHSSVELLYCGCAKMANKKRIIIVGNYFTGLSRDK